MVVEFDPFQVSTPHIFYACLGGFVVFFGMVSLFLREKLYMGEALIGFVFGVIIGPYGVDIFNPHQWAGGSETATDTITLEFTRVVLAIGVFAIGVELPKAYMRSHWKSLAFLVGPVMTWGWFVCAGLIYAFIPGLNFLSCLAIAACLTPTDPILAAAVVGGKWADKHVPAHLRHLLAAESGCNDGAAFPFLFISLYLLLYRNVGEAIRDWFLFMWLYQIILGVLIGALLGFGFRHLMKFCQRLNLIDRESYVAQYISLAMLTLGVTTLLGSDDLLACFACGVAFAWDGFFNKQTEEAVFSSVIDLLFNVSAFVYVGAWMPFASFNDIHSPLRIWRLIVLAILVLLLRRLPIIIGLYKWIPDIKTFREAIFSGHFGPIGIGAVFISTLAVEVIHHDKHTKTEQIILLEHVIQPIVAFMVLCSVAIHGLSIPGFSLGRRVRTVSRTWSRHAAAPDWATQLKIVDRGADIVINRDSVMEQGLSRKGLESRTMTMSTSGKRGEEEVKDDVETPVEKVEGRPEGEVVTAWREPHHTILERQRLPADDVKVDVIEDNLPNTSGVSTGIRHSLGLLEGLKKAAGNLEHRAAQSVAIQIAAIEAHMNQLLSTSVLDKKAEEDEKIAEDDDDEAWASENEPSFDAPDGHRESRSRTPKTKEQSSGKTQVHHVHHHHHHQHQHSLGSIRRAGRRRSSVRTAPSPAPEDSRHLAQPTIRITTGSPIYAEPEPELESPMHSPSHCRQRVLSSLPTPITASSSPLISRPRTAPSVSTPPRSATRPNTADSPGASRHRDSRNPTRPGTGDSAYSRRIEHLRMLHTAPTTRDSSPSRSIRFKDQLPSGTGGRPIWIPPDEDGAMAGTSSGGTGKFPRTSTIQ